MSNKKFEPIAAALDALSELLEDAGVKVGTIILEHTDASTHYALFGAGLDDAEMNNETGAFVGKWRNVPVCSFLVGGGTK